MTECPFWLTSSLLEEVCPGEVCNLTGIWDYQYLGLETTPDRLNACVTFPDGTVICAQSAPPKPPSILAPGASEFTFSGASLTFSPQGRDSCAYIPELSAGLWAAGSAIESVNSLGVHTGTFATDGVNGAVLQSEGSLCDAPLHGGLITSLQFATYAGVFQNHKDGGGVDFVIPLREIQYAPTLGVYLAVSTYSDASGLDIYSSVDGVVWVTHATLPGEHVTIQKYGSCFGWSESQQVVFVRTDLGVFYSADFTTWVELIPAASFMTATDRFAFTDAGGEVVIAQYAANALYLRGFKGGVMTLISYLEGYQSPAGEKSTFGHPYVSSGRCTVVVAEYGRIVSVDPIYLPDAIHIGT